MLNQDAAKAQAPLLSPVVRSPGTGDVFPYFAAEFERVLARAQTNDALSVLRLQITPEGAPPLHMHSREDEIWVVLDGEVKFWTGGRTLADCDASVVSSGSVVFGPRLVPHTFQSQTPTSQVLMLIAPGAFEDHMLLVGAPGARVSEEEYGISVLDRAPVPGQD